MTPVKKQWMEVCQASLGEELSLYDQFLRTFILERAKVCILLHGQIIVHVHVCMCLCEWGCVFMSVYGCVSICVCVIG